MSSRPRRKSVSSRRLSRSKKTPAIHTHYHPILFATKGDMKLVFDPVSNRMVGITTAAGKRVFARVNAGTYPLRDRATLELYRSWGGKGGRAIIDEWF